MRDNDLLGPLGLATGLVMVGLMLVVLAPAMRNGSLARNGLVGVRTPAIRRSDEAWAAGHRAGARVAAFTGWWSLAFAVVSAIVVVVAHNSVSEGVLYAAPAFGFLGMLVGVAVMTVKANAAAKAGET